MSAHCLIHKSRGHRRQIRAPIPTVTDEVCDSIGLLGPTSLKDRRRDSKVTEPPLCLVSELGQQTKPCLSAQFQTSCGMRKRNPGWAGSVGITRSPLISASGRATALSSQARHPGFSPRAWGEPGSFPRSPDPWIRLPSLNLYCRALCTAKSTRGLRTPVGSWLPGRREGA